jgi:hypothetical protein
VYLVLESDCKLDGKDDQSYWFELSEGHRPDKESKDRKEGKWRCAFPPKVLDGCLNVLLRQKQGCELLSSARVDLNWTRQQGHLNSGIPYLSWMQLKQQVRSSGGEIQWIPAKTSAGTEKKVRLLFCWNEKSTQPVAALVPAPSPAAATEEQMAESLRVFLHGACNLPPARQGGYQPYCVLCITPQEVEQQIKYTSIQSSANPIWRSNFTFSLEDPKVQHLALVVCHQQEETVESNVGKVLVRLDTLELDTTCALTVPLMYNNEGQWEKHSRSATVSLELTLGSHVDASPPASVASEQVAPSVASSSRTHASAGSAVMLATTAAGREAQRGTMLSSQQQQEKWMAKIEKTQKSQAKERAELEDDERDGRLFIQDLARLVLHASPRQ